MKTLTPGRFISEAAAALVLMLTAVALAGWAFQVEPLTSVMPAWPKLVPATALGLMLCVASLWLQARKPDGERRLSAVLACMVLAFGTAMLISHLLEWTPISFLISRPGQETPLTLSSPITAAMFIVTGASLWFMTRENTVGLAQGIAIGELLATLLTVFGYLFHGTFLYQLLPGKGTSILTTTAFAFLSIGILFLRPSLGITLMITDDTAGARASSQLLILTWTAPVIIGVASLIGFKTGIYGIDAAIPLVVWGLISLFTVVIFLFARQLHFSEIARDRVEEDLRKTRNELEIRVAERTRELEHLVTHDRLTGLPNRTLLVDRLQNAIAFARRDRRMIPVVYLDLDSFSYINTGFGVECGDKVLKEIALRLSQSVRCNDTIARIGSDEFVILFAGLENEMQCSARLTAILDAVREPINVDGKEIVVTCSIGGCFYPLDGEEHERLLRRANAAMKRAKAMGKDSIQFFAESRDSAVIERMHLEVDLRKAISEGNLILHYQPKLDLRTGKYSGAEALVRWGHPVKGLILPSDFIPLAEESKLIIPLGEWVLMQACLQARIWQEAGFDGAAVAVNLSARQFHDGRIVGIVQRVLQDTGIDPWRLELEITESSIMHDVNHVIGLMRELKQLGVSISIDDFGTGHSSLGTLRNLPADKLKIDKSFVHEIDMVQNAAAVALAVIRFAKSLGMRVIAEGVETAGQAEFLLRHGCDELQGYLIAPPLKIEQAQELFSQPFTPSWPNQVSAHNR